jgi:hypothetical protein
MGRVCNPRPIGLPRYRVRDREREEVGPMQGEPPSLSGAAATVKTCGLVAAPELSRVPISRPAVPPL